MELDHLSLFSHVMNANVKGILVKNSTGSNLFWVYFAVSIPLIFLVFAGTFVIQLGYDNSAVWSFEKFKKACIGKIF